MQVAVPKKTFLPTLQPQLTQPQLTQPQLTQSVFNSPLPPVREILFARIFENLILKIRCTMLVW
jgi:hypothetical protein